MRRTEFVDETNRSLLQTACSGVHLAFGWSVDEDCGVGGAWVECCQCICGIRCYCAGMHRLPTIRDI